MLLTPRSASNSAARSSQGFTCVASGACVPDQARARTTRRTPASRHRGRPRRGRRRCQAPAPASLPEVAVRDDDSAERAAEPRSVHGHLLAERRRRRRLTVGVRQHGRPAVLLREVDERVPNLANRGHDRLAHGLLHQKALGEVVHVLAREPEVDPRVQGLAVGNRSGIVQPVQSNPQESTLDRLHVVVGRGIPLGPSTSSAFIRRASSAENSS